MTNIGSKSLFYLWELLDKMHLQIIDACQQDIIVQLSLANIILSSYA